MLSTLMVGTVQAELVTVDPVADNAKFLGDFWCGTLDGTWEGERCTAQYRPYPGNACEKYEQLQSNSYTSVDSPWFLNWVQKQQQTACSPATIHSMMIRSLILRVDAMRGTKIGTELEFDPVRRPNGVGVNAYYLIGECIIARCANQAGKSGDLNATGTRQTTGIQSSQSSSPPSQGTLPKCTGAGTWTNCVVEGTYPDGTKYIGPFENDKPSGRGVAVFPNGNKYVGQFQNGSFNGLGTLTYSDGREYIGNFKDGKFNGEGTLYGPHGSSLKRGPWEDGKLVSNRSSSSSPPSQGTLPNCTGPDAATWTNCVGEVTNRNGVKYVGQYQDGKQLGQATVTFPNGNKYVGRVENRGFNGLGTFTYRDGSEYVGHFKDGKFNGEGTFYGPNRSSLQRGPWEDGKLVSNKSSAASGKSSPEFEGTSAPARRDVRPQEERKKEQEQQREQARQQELARRQQLAMQQEAARKKEEDGRRRAISVPAASTPPKDPDSLPKDHPCAEMNNSPSFSNVRSCFKQLVSLYPGIGQGLLMDELLRRSEQYVKELADSSNN